MYLSAYARQPARGPTMLAHFVAMLAYVGLCWPMLAYVGLCWLILRAMWAQLGAMLAHLKTMLAYLEGYVGRSWGLCRPILRLLAHLGAMLAYLEGNVGPSWGYVGHLGAMLAYLGGYVAPSGGYVDPSWGLCWPMLTHLQPQAPKNGKMGAAKNTVKRGSFWRGGLSAAGAAAPFSFGEEQQKSL